ncbi:thiol-disulfide oxidoreductase DCC family protein [Paenibacillus tepidiphilus]|uniref:thiol-disulfide oxidoreductase DCC family protein n=1 Tax=Paenibacillus tepidiphilus TaxID=2608683 RepID=UPI00123A377B|nr:DCC1-like thiol-disulfide oxidoreductase family protein [Paenibacillus tepidiphilus]
MSEGNREKGQTVVLIDGVCHLCQGIVRFIIPRDPRRRIRFAALQCEAGQELLKAGGLPGNELSSVVVVEDGVYYRESAAVLRIARRLRFPWPMAYVFILIPPPLRNALYRMVARNRYRWFGRDEQCLMPTPEIRNRFL